MIIHNTVLVLGAGSAPPGFPSGYGLVKEICHGWTNSGPGKIGGLLAKLPEFDLDEVQRFVNALNTSGQLSVDRFLEHRADLVRVGKAAIALALIRYELSASLHLRDRPPSWYDLLFHAMSTPTLDEWGENNLGVVTFNYDRSLEQYFLVSLASTYGKRIPEVAKELSKIQIIHVHGMLGGLPPLHPKGRTYSPEHTSETISIAAGGIRIVSEAAEDDPVFAEAQELLASASRILFLGFGYDPLNLERLNAKSLSDGRELIGGTAFELTDAERVKVQRFFGEKFFLGPSHRQADIFLRDIPGLDE